ncbi:family 43 glycosylhydrolase [Luoshenia tenuis]|jgi:xylan 1,4-beta-xylosidase|uniref:family 43 glycosylhydrolase n=1 Tax=Luoshenia tenuis TaxID=2763654 RepID=UPI003D93340B
MDRIARTYCSDLGDGTYLNPLLHGEYPDPSILKDGKDYYMVNCSQPMLWHSQDLLHWEPVCMLPYPMGGAADLCKIDDTYLIYNIDPFVRDEADYRPVGIYAITTKDIQSGRWEGPFFVGPALNLHNGAELIDPGMLEDLEGRRWLFMSDNYCFPLSQDGLHLTGPGVRVLEDEVFPDDWEIQGVYTEGPRFTKKDGWIYLTLAAGGTEGPPTSHGVFSYRSRSALGPWERSPYNPIIRTRSRHEKWLSKGHGTLVEAPDGAWYMIYHAFLKDRYNQARMLLMEPVEWTEDGWFRVPEWSDPAKPLPAPKGGEAVLHGYPTKIEFPEATPLPGQWLPKGNLAGRMENVENGLRIRGQGTGMHDCGGALCYQGLFRNFEVTVHATVGAGAGMALGMYYGQAYSTGFGLKDNWIWTFWPNCRVNRCHGKPYNWDEIYMKMVVHEQVISLYFGPDGQHWEKNLNSTNFDHVSCLASIEREDLSMAMLPALFTYGNGEVVYHSFEIRPIPDEDLPPQE